MKKLTAYTIAAIVGTLLGILIGYLVAPYVVEQHYHFDEDGVEVVREIPKE